LLGEPARIPSRASAGRPRINIDEQKKEALVKELAGKTVLVTGAASGIGRETALAFAREGCTLLLNDINEDGLDAATAELKALQTDCRTYLADVSNAEAVKLMADRVTEDFGALDILVNVAGVCVVADTVDTPLEDWEWIMGVNLWGPIHTVHFFLPSMISRKAGHIVNVSSAAGLIPFSLITAYTTTKHGLVGFGEALAQEMREHKINVTTVCPGVTNTPIIGHMRFHGYSAQKFEKFNQTVINRSLSPARLAEMIVEGVRRNRPMVMPVSARILYVVKRISPRLVNYIIARGRPLNQRLYR